jgi:HSP20 family molecular chaperone IbpA
MTVERYDTPNHPRWNLPTNDRADEQLASRPASRRRYGRASRRRGERRREETPGARRSEGRRGARQSGGTPSAETSATKPTPTADPRLLQSREATGDDATVELRATSDRVCVTTELPDRSLDDVRVSVVGASVHIRAESSARSGSSASPENGIDRTITLPETVSPADVMVAYHDPVLAVVVPR